MISFSMCYYFFYLKIFFFEKQIPFSPPPKRFSSVHLKPYTFHFTASRLYQYVNELKAESSLSTQPLLIYIKNSFLSAVFGNFFLSLRTGIHHIALRHSSLRSTIN